MAGSGMNGEQFDFRNERPGPARFTVAAADVGSVGRPGRVSNRTKTEPEAKVKKPADGVRKKTPPARKAPARGRYVDEYARPAF